MSLTTESAQRLTKSNQWFRYWFPYVFQPMKVTGAKHVYLPLNRNYKPLGCTGREHVKYEDYLHQAIRFSTDPSKFKDIWIDKHGLLWLYEDAVSTRLDYFARLERLLSRSVPLFSQKNVN